MQHPVFLFALFHIPAFADILAAGADGEPAAVAADIRQHLRGSLGIHGPDEVLIDIILFFQAKVFHGLAVVPLYLFLGVAQVFAQLVGAAGAEGDVEEAAVDT